MTPEAAQEFLSRAVQTAFLMKQDQVGILQYSVSEKHNIDGQTLDAKINSICLEYGVDRKDLLRLAYEEELRFDITWAPVIEEMVKGILTWIGAKLFESALKTLGFGKASDKVIAEIRRIESIVRKLFVEQIKRDMAFFQNEIHEYNFHMEGTDSVPRSAIETAAESILKERVGKNFESVKCVESECTFEYSALNETEAEKITNSAEADLVAKGFAGVKVNATESLSSGLLRSVFFGLGMGLASAIFGAL